MNLRKYGIMMAAVLLLATSAALAEGKSERNITIVGPVNIGSTQLAPGHYKVEWQGMGPTVQVRFLHDGRTVATSDARLVTQRHKSPYDDVVITKTSASNSTLQEIDFQNRSEALVFGNLSGT